MSQNAEVQDRIAASQLMSMWREVVRVCHPKLAFLFVPLVTALGYMAFGVAERWISAPLPNRGSVWWPAGIAVALTYYFGNRVLIGIFIAEWCVNTFEWGYPVWVGVISAIGNCAESWVGAALLTKTGFNDKLERVRDVLCLLAVSLCAPLAMVVPQLLSNLSIGKSTIDVALFAMPIWYSSDAIALLYVVPIVSAFVGFRELAASWHGRAVELTIYLAALIFVTSIIFGVPSSYFFVGVSACALPMIIVIAFRFDPWSTAIALFSYAAVIAVCMALYIDPFPHRVANAFPYLHLHYLSVVLLGLLLAAVVAERREIERRMQQLARWEGIGTLVEGIAHQLNNQLTVVLGASDLVRDVVPENSPAIPLVDMLNSTTGNIAKIAENLLAYSGRGVEPSTTQITDIVRLLREETSALSTRITVASSPKFPELNLRVDTALLRVAVRNLLRNALESIESNGGDVTVGADCKYYGSNNLANAWPVEPKPGKYVCIRVSDTGCGMEPEVKLQMFDPFFSTKFVGRGLGLAAVAGVARQSQGCVLVTSQIGIGTTMDLLLPVFNEGNLV